MAGGITTAELLDALARATAGDGPDDAKTLSEWSDATGISPLRLKRAFHELQRQDRLLAHRVRRARMDGLMTLVPAYTILPAKKK